MPYNVFNKKFLDFILSELHSLYLILKAVILIIYIDYIIKLLSYFFILILLYFIILNIFDDILILIFKFILSIIWL